MTRAVHQTNTTDRRWLRAIILADISDFPASIEQLENTALRGRPVVITNGDQGSCILSCSHEARAWGVRKGMWLPEAKRLCPDLVRVNSRTRRYEEISVSIVSALQAITPDIAVFSLHEIFLDVTTVQRLYGAPPVIARHVQRVIHEVSGLHCSIGVAGDKTTAKWAAKQHQPVGLTVIPPWETAARLRQVPVSELCGVGRGIGEFLASQGVRTCSDMRRLPVSVLTQRWGNIGRRVWLMAQGRDPDPVNPDGKPPNHIGLRNVLAQETCDGQLLQRQFDDLAAEVAARLRKKHLEAQQFYIGLRTGQGWLGGRFLTLQTTDDGQAIGRLCRKMLSRLWHGEKIQQVQVTALDPAITDEQLRLFLDEVKNVHRAVNHDVVLNNRRFDPRVTVRAPLHGRAPFGDGNFPI